MANVKVAVRDEHGKITNYEVPGSTLCRDFLKQHYPGYTEADFELCNSPSGTRLRTVLPQCHKVTVVSDRETDVGAGVIHKGTSLVRFYAAAAAATLPKAEVCAKARPRREC